MLKRAILILTAVVLATAAPLRAWCEANCVASAQTETTSSHCQTPEPDSDTTSMSALIVEDCPTVESARPTALAKPVFAPAIVTWQQALLAPTPVSAHPSRSGVTAPKHLALTPLRI